MVLLFQGKLDGVKEGPNLSRGGGWGGGGGCGGPMETYRTFDFPGVPRGLEPLRSMYEKRLSAANKYIYQKIPQTILYRKSK